MFNLEAPDWWVQVPALTGPTLWLREVEAEDVDALFELLTDPQVSQYISQPPSSAAAFEGFIEWAHRQREAGTCVCFGVVPHGLEHAIGLFQVRALDSTFQTPVSVLSHRPVRRRSPGRKLMRRARQG